MMSRSGRAKKGDKKMLNRVISSYVCVRTILVLIPLLTILGCAPALVPTDYNITSSSARSDRIPLRAGLYLSEKFSKAALIGNKGGREVPILVGDSLVTGAKRTITLAFEDMVLMESLDPKNAHGARIIVTPEIVNMDNVLVGFPPWSKWESRLSCKWTIKNLDGDVIYLNTIVGEGRYEAVTSAFTYRDRLAQSMLPAIQDQYGKLLADLMARRWWEDR